MLREWQINSVKDVAFPEDINGIVIGDEGCIYRSLLGEWVPIVEEAIKRGLSVRFITPPVPDNKIDQLMDLIVSLLKLTKLKITFNDYGMLYKCRNLIEKNKVVPVLGRILTRSILECPWQEELIKHENPKLVDAISGYNFSHKSKRNFLHDYNIEEIEININHAKYKNQFQNFELNLTSYMSNRVISVGRVCYSAKWQSLVLPDCRKDNKCRKKLFISLDKKWGKMKMMYENPCDLIKEKFEHLYVQGNIVFKSIEVDLYQNWSNSLYSIIV